MVLNEIKKEIHELRDKYSAFVEENNRMSLRAAVGFDGLTPRPSYKSISNKFVSDYEYFDPVRDKPTNSTAKIFEGLLKALGECGEKINQMMLAEVSRSESPTPLQR